MNPSERIADMSRHPLTVDIRGYSHILDEQPLSPGPYSSRVAGFQSALSSMGYELPRYGCDGRLGGETYQALEEFCRDHAMLWPVAAGIVSGGCATQVKAIAASEAQLYASALVSDVRGTAKASNVKKWRQWKDVTAVVLHQTGVWMTDTPRRFERLRAHMGILRHHERPIVTVGDPRAYMYHANELNSFSYGIEINGSFGGLDTEPSKRPTMLQCEMAIRGIEFACNLVRAHGGRVTEIFPHRVVSSFRRADPGEYVWKHVALPAMARLGLEDGGPGYCLEDGRPIPHQWDSSRTAGY